MKNLLTEYSGWYFLLCLLVGLAYAWLLYTKKSPWSRWINRSLAGARFFLVATLCFLLLGPYLKQVKNYFEQPVVVMAIDDSQSISLVNDSSFLQQTLGTLDSMRLALEDNGYSVDVKRLSPSISSGEDKVDDITFSAGSSNLGNMLGNIQAQYENQNMAAVVLLSDGIYNQGISPSYTPYSMPIYTVGVGDTMPQTDVNLKNVYANKIAYLGNKFPIVAEVFQNGFEGKVARVNLLQNGEVLDSKEITFSQSKSLNSVEFLVESKAEGVQRYTLQSQPIDGEFTDQNNTKNVYIDILDSKEKILIVAASPHPDIKAIRAALQTKENYEIRLLIPSLVTNPVAKDSVLNDKYDLVIFHQMPDRRGTGNDLLEKFVARKVAMWFILGGQSNLRAFNQLNYLVDVQVAGRQVDRVTPVFNSRFDRFKFEDDQKSVITKFPPISVPFGKYSLLGDAEVLLYQRVGTISTEKPLLVTGTFQDVKGAVLLGEGIWQWRLQEYSLERDQNAFDDLISKMVQYLSTKEDKRKFRVYTPNDEYLDAETVFFETEVYNNIYENIYGQKVDLRITNEVGESRDYTYVNNGAGFRYAVNGLPQGIYKFQASTQLNGKLEESSGEFTVKKLEIEAINTTADFNLLRNLSRQSDGDFYNTDQLDQLTSNLIEGKPADTIHSQEEFEEVLNINWILAILLFLASIEWFVRKYKGAY